MGSLGSMLGIGGSSGDEGLNFTPQGAYIQQGANQQQVQSGISTSNNALAQQQAFLQALQGQNGVGNQSSVFNQLQGVANGTGPNPAQAMLAQSTGQNIANQAALMAGGRGAGANVGLVARQAAQTGSGIQQQAAGQAATMQANQSLNAMGQLGNLASQQVSQQAGALQNYNQGAQQQESNLMGSLNAYNNANVSQQSNINNVEGNMAQAGAAQQGALTSGLMNSGSNALSSLMGAEGGKVFKDKIENPRKKMADGGPSLSNQNFQDFGTSTPAQLSTQIAGPSTEPISTTGSPKSKAAKYLANPTSQQNQPPKNPEFEAGQAVGNLIGTGLKKLFGSGSSDSQPATGPGSVEQNFKLPPGPYGASATPSTPASSDAISQDTPSTPASSDAISQDTSEKSYAKGGKVKALLSPGEGYLPPHKVDAVKKGKANPVAIADKVPGKAKVKGDSLKNDVVKANLDVGGIVLPRTVMNAKDPAKEAHKFVSAILAKQSMKRKK